ncbi:MAG: radical SAM protein [Clostridiales bacterium]|nr:MAG: radical SAM protein [Clostridiales bacterium]
MEPARKTKSLCPVCLKIIDADIIEEGGSMYMKKTCPEHGTFKTVVWRENSEKYLEWTNAAGNQPRGAFPNPKSVSNSCPYDCGYCQAHKQDLCSAALMVTGKCNLNCPVCFTRTRNSEPYHPSLDELKSQLDGYLRQTGSPYPLEFCGGEPTVRDDLPLLAEYAKGLGYDYIQLNTNGIRISKDMEYLERLRDSGITTVYLGFDGFNDETYNYTSGESLLEHKMKAVENCKKARIAVVLVPVVVPGRNENELGRIIEYAKANTPAVKGVFFQPISYFGHIPKIPTDDDRITIPEVLDKIEEQTCGEVKRNNFLPPVCEHPLCSFNAFFLLKKGKLYPMTKFSQRKPVEDAAERTRIITKRNWTYNEQEYLTIGGMAFQDAWNIDLERLERCTIGIISGEKGIVPLCAKYLTSESGEKLYPGIA